MLSILWSVQQVMDLYEIRCSIRHTYDDADPEWFHSAPVTLILSDQTMSQDDLTITLALMRLWSEMTI
jgi:hypothetical protein